MGKTLGGTGLWPVVSGVTPETVVRCKICLGRAINRRQCLTTKFGGTPNLTGETPVPPKSLTKKSCSFCSFCRKLAETMSSLANQIAVVTGAGRGIGRAIAFKFAVEGPDVVCVSRRQENSEKVAAEIRALGRKAWAFAVGRADSAAVSAAGEKILAECGKVDILVNNAGVTRDGLVMRMSDADWDTVLDTNLKGAFLVTKAFSRAFVKQRAGRVINVSSVIGLIGNAGQCNYAASKAGLIGFTQSVARELASRGITVNAIAPRFIDTDMTRA